MYFEFKFNIFRAFKLIRYIFIPISNLVSSTSYSLVAYIVANIVLVRAECDTTYIENIRSRFNMFLLYLMNCCSF
jgi:phage shock protein PspC (stress-responsive transcriptional regulator)